MVHGRHRALPIRFFSSLREIKEDGPRRIERRVENVVVYSYRGGRRKAKSRGSQHPARNRSSLARVYYNEIGFRLARFQAAFIKSEIPPFFRPTRSSFFLTAPPLFFFSLSLSPTSSQDRRWRERGERGSFQLSSFSPSSSESWPDLQLVLCLPAFRLFPRKAKDRKEPRIRKGKRGGGKIVPDLRFLRSSGLKERKTDGGGGGNISISRIFRETGCNNLLNARNSTRKEAFHLLSAETILFLSRRWVTFSPHAARELRLLLPLSSHTYLHALMLRCVVVVVQILFKVK